MKQKIVSYRKDELSDWVAVLECGHGQHVRHNPPMVSRPWTLTEEGRVKMIGFELNCVKCDESESANAAD